ncbi:hypothetical protein NLU13_2214 [Sarocladium strictum]|uniref:Protein kinase domain-containing protein n=1 Tax=Sarocladium strictum TaxID=5046 RepID=A0AA39LD85_SARSR|nr:hypothetical protein NLU13_2214 [Sarocladium strictum]
MRERPLKQKYRTRQGLQMKAAQIGSGASFTVTKRHTFENPPKVVVMKDTNLKFDRIGRPNDGAVFVSVATEIEILGHKSLYDHANIVTLLDVRWDHPSMYKQAHGPTLYLEYANMGTLSHYFEWHPTQASNMSRTSNILFDVCLGLQALHRYGITHGDLKPSNVLIFEELGAVTAKLSDFGCSVIQRRTSGPTSELTGFSPPWDAPEAGEVVPSDVLHKSDIYSFGLMYWWCRLWGAQGSKPMTGGEGAFISGTTADLKALKKAEDLGPMMHGSILAAMRNSGCYGLDELELSLVASATLNLRPEERSLETVLEAMQQSLSPPREVRSADVGDMLFPTAEWDPDKAWDIRLEHIEARHTVSRRFHDAVRLLLESSSKSKSQRQALNVLLFRCFFEGFGTEENLELAAYHLRQAAASGSASAMSLLSRFHDIAGIRLPPEVPLERYLVQAMTSGDYLAAKELAKLNPVLFTETQSQHRTREHEDLRYDSEDSFISSVKSWSPSRAISERFGSARKTVVHFAAALGWSRALAMLVHYDDFYECRRFLNAVDDSGHTPLLLALINGHLEAVSVLLDHGEFPWYSHSLVSNFPESRDNLFTYLLGVVAETGGARDGLLRDVCGRLAGAGADPNAKNRLVADGGTLGEAIVTNHDGISTVGNVDRWFETVMEAAVANDNIALVQALLDVGAVPTAAAFHLAAGLHQSEAFKAMIQHPCCPFMHLSQLDVLGRTVVNTAIDSFSETPFYSPIRRYIYSGKPIAQSCRDLLHCLSTFPGFSLREVGLPVSPAQHTPPENDGSPYWMATMARAHVCQPAVLEFLLGPNLELLDDSSPTGDYNPPLYTALLLGSDKLALHLLSLHAATSIDARLGLLTAYANCFCPDNATVCQRLIEAGCDLETTVDRTSDGVIGLETAFQTAVLYQNFNVAACLFENGANRDHINFSVTSEGNVTLLGALIHIIWNDSQNRIRWLFEAYPNSPAPAFIVAPMVGLSALQLCAKMSPENARGESGAKHMMEYLVERYQGAYHVEYQRFDNDSDHPDTR